MKIRPFLGADLRLKYQSTPGRFEDADLTTTNRLAEVAAGLNGGALLQNQREASDLQRVTGVENMIQSLVNRIKTAKGELAALGHPEYGSRHHELIGALNTATNRNLVKLHVLEALSHEPRVEKILRAEVKTAPADRTRVDVQLQIKIVEIPAPLNLVIPFSFAGRI